MSLSWTCRTVAVGGAALLALGTTTVPAAAGPGASAKGAFRLPTGAASTTMGGHAHLVRTGSGASLLSVHVTGLTAGAVYGVHLHDATCAAGLGHYKNSANPPATPPNELWASSDPANPQAGIRAGVDGVAHGSGKAPWRARPEARSVVVHVPGSTAGGTRLLCADLG